VAGERDAGASRKPATRLVTNRRRSRMELSSSARYLVRTAQTAGEYFGRGERDCVEGTTQAAQAIYKTGRGRQGSEEDCHSSSPRAAGLYLGDWNQSRDYFQAGSCSLTTTKAKQKLPKKERAKNTESMNAGSSQGKHEGEPSLGLCDRLDRTRDNSQRQLPTDHDYAVPTREYQTDQSSFKSAPTAARSVFGKGKKQRQQQNQPHCCAELTRHSISDQVTHRSVAKAQTYIRTERDHSGSSAYDCGRHP
jgi:hypothetical protein